MLWPKTYAHHCTVLNPSHLHHHTVLCTDAIMSSKVKSECSMCVHILHARQIRNRVRTVWNQDLDSKLLSLYDTRNQGLGSRIGDVFSEKQLVLFWDLRSVFYL